MAPPGMSPPPLPSVSFSSHQPLPPPISLFLLPSVSFSSHQPLPPPISLFLLPSVSFSSHQSLAPPISHFLLPSVSSSSHQSLPPPISLFLLPSVSCSSHQSLPPPISLFLLPSVHQRISASSLSELVQSVKMKTRERNCEEDLSGLRSDMKKKQGRRQGFIIKEVLHLSCGFICVFAVLINKVSLQETVEAVIGGSVLLPCSSTEHDLKLQDINVFWRHNGSKSVYDIIEGSHSQEKQDTVFKNRIETFPEEYESGNFSIRLTNLTRTDGGKYICFITHSSEQPTVQLIIKGV
ncbi:unnamed protein product [Leuciscus chuanchicus]